jgi:hypothetical protein
MKFIRFCFRSGNYQRIFVFWKKFDVRLFCNHGHFLRTFQTIFGRFHFEICQDQKIVKRSDVFHKIWQKNSVKIWSFCEVFVNMILVNLYDLRFGSKFAFHILKSAHGGGVIEHGTKMDFVVSAALLSSVLSLAESLKEAGSLILRSMMTAYWPYSYVQFSIRGMLTRVPSSVFLCCTEIF